eukprot:940746-Amphidinium_carterae.1
MHHMDVRVEVDYITDEVPGDLSVQPDHVVSCKLAVHELVSEQGAEFNLKLFMGKEDICESFETAQGLAFSAFTNYPEEANLMVYALPFCTNYSNVYTTFQEYILELPAGQQAAYTTSPLRCCSPPADVTIHHAIYIPVEEGGTASPVVAIINECFQRDLIWIPPIMLDIATSSHHTHRPPMGALPTASTPIAISSTEPWRSTVSYN